jgi:hypothetical protein
MKSLITELSEYKENALILIVAVYLYGVYKAKLYYKARKFHLPIYIYDIFKKGQYAGREHRHITLIDYFGKEYGYDELFYGLLSELQANGTSIDEINLSLKNKYISKKLKKEVQIWIDKNEAENEV